MLTITGTGGAVTHMTTVTLVISAPAASDFSLSASPGNVTVKHDGTANYTVSVTPSSGFAGAVTLSVSGLPGGASASFNVNPIAGGSGSSTLSVNTGAAAPGTYALTVTGVSGSLTHSTTVTLKIH